MNRDTFLTRIREAAHRGRAHRVHLPEIPAGTGYVGAADDLSAALAAEVQAVGGSAHVVPDMAAAREALVDLLRELQVRSALCWQHAVLDELGLSHLLDVQQIARYDFDALTELAPGERRQTILSADIGISSVDYAIAETGTLVVCSRQGQERIATLLPPVHVAVVVKRQIVPDLFDVFEGLADNTTGLPSNIALITGPSKTGDIELQLTTGVHGPGRWHVVVVDQGTT